MGDLTINFNAYKFCGMYIRRYVGCPNNYSVSM